MRPVVENIVEPIVDNLQALSDIESLAKRAEAWIQRTSERASAELKAVIRRLPSIDSLLPAIDPQLSGLRDEIDKAIPDRLKKIDVELPSVVRQISEAVPAVENLTQQLKTVSAFSLPSIDITPVIGVNGLLLPDEFASLAGSVVLPRIRLDEIPKFLQGTVAKVANSIEVEGTNFGKAIRKVGRDVDSTVREYIEHVENIDWDDPKTYLGYDAANTAVRKLSVFHETDDSYMIEVYVGNSRKQEWGWVDLEHAVVSVIDDESGAKVFETTVYDADIQHTRWGKTGDPATDVVTEPVKEDEITRFAVSVPINSSNSHTITIGVKEDGKNRDSITGRIELPLGEEAMVLHVDSSWEQHIRNARVNAMDEKASDADSDSVSPQSGDTRSSLLKRGSGILGNAIVTADNESEAVKDRGFELPYHLESADLYKTSDGKFVLGFDMVQVTHETEVEVLVEEVNEDGESMYEQQLRNLKRIHEELRSHYEPLKEWTNLYFEDVGTDVSPSYENYKTELYRRYLEWYASHDESGNPSLNIDEFWFADSDALGTFPWENGQSLWDEYVDDVGLETNATLKAVHRAGTQGPDIESIAKPQKLTLRGEDIKHGVDLTSHVLESRDRQMNYKVSLSTKTSKITKPVKSGFHMLTPQEATALYEATRPANLKKGSEKTQEFLFPMLRGLRCRR